jgi:hypothetical protein
MHRPDKIGSQLEDSAEETDPESVIVEADPGFCPHGAGPRERNNPFHVDPAIWDMQKPLSTSTNTRHPACKGPIFMNDCVNKNGKCFCKPAACMLGVDCYTVEAKHCDAEYKSCQYPMEGSC